MYTGCTKRNIKTLWTGIRNVVVVMKTRVRFVSRLVRIKLKVV